VTTDLTAQVVRLRDGRALGYAEYGCSQGDTVFFFHGWPNSRLEAAFGAVAAARLGVRLIGVDRPGYGLSDFCARRRLLDWPDDVVQLSDRLGGPWGFRLEDISVDVHLWHGTEDDKVPLAMARYVARAIPRCRARFVEGEGHLSVLVRHGEDIFEAVS